MRVYPEHTYPLLAECGGDMVSLVLLARGCEDEEVVVLVGGREDNDPLDDLRAHVGGFAENHLKSERREEP